jgi:hypothetical protein
MKWMIGVCLSFIISFFFVALHFFFICFDGRIGSTFILGSSWKICKESGLKWGGRGFGGRAAGRNTVQTKDVVIEGCTLAYLGTNLLERTTLRLLQRRRYGLIGRNGVGKRYSHHIVAASYGIAVLYL